MTRIVDRLLPRVRLIPSHTTDTAGDRAELLFFHLLLQHSLPNRISTDKNLEFTSKFGRILFTLCKAKFKMGSAAILNEM